MRADYKKAGASTVAAEITRRDGGGFVAVASTGDLDRDGEVIAPGSLYWATETVAVHLDHTMSAAAAIGRGRPHYVGKKLMIDVTFASTPDAQLVRQKVADGIIDSVSIVFLDEKWEKVDGVRTLVKGQLLATDVVSVPSQPNARILSMRAVRTASREMVREIAADAVLVLARAEIAECKAMGIGADRRGVMRRQLDNQLRDVLSTRETATEMINRFKRSM